MSLRARRHTLLPPLLLALVACGCGGEETAAPRPRDRTPPGRVTDLEALRLTATSARVAWTAPGDDGLAGRAARYDLRYRSAGAGSFDWEIALRYTSPPDPPGPAGTLEVIEIAGLLDDELYRFALRTADEALLWSEVSNIAELSEVDRIPPARIEDLAPLEATATTITLIWTAPGDDGRFGRAGAYDLRLSDQVFEAEEFAQIARVPGTHRPLPAGRGDGHRLRDLEPGRRYWVAVRTLDEAGNAAAPSEPRAVQTEAAIR